MAEIGRIQGGQTTGSPSSEGVDLQGEIAKASKLAIKGLLGPGPLRKLENLGVDGATLATLRDAQARGVAGDALGAQRFLTALSGGDPSRWNQTAAGPEQAAALFSTATSARTAMLSKLNGQIERLPNGPAKAELQQMSESLKRNMELGTQVRDGRLVKSSTATQAEKAATFLTGALAKLKKPTEATLGPWLEQAKANLSQPGVAGLKFTQATSATEDPAAKRQAAISWLKEEAARVVAGAKSSANDVMPEGDKMGVHLQAFSGALNQERPRLINELVGRGIKSNEASELVRQALAGELQ